MKILSREFDQEESIPKTYTCDGENINPPLMFVDVPPEAKSLALLMEDPDVPKNLKSDGLFVHWLVWDMPPDVSEIPEGVEAPGVIGQNSSGTAGYTGPCPPDGQHRYFFRLYALDTELTSQKIANKDDLLQAMEGHILAQAELMAKYNRN